MSSCEVFFITVFYVSLIYVNVINKARAGQGITHIYMFRGCGVFFSFLFFLFLFFFFFEATCLFDRRAGWAVASLL